MDPKPPLLGTRHKIKVALDDLNRQYTDGEIDEAAWFAKSVQILERARGVAALDRALLEAPQSHADRAMAILSSWCEPPDVPDEDEIERVLAEMRALQAQLS